MKSALLVKLNTPLTLAEIETGPLQIGQVLVRVLVSGICGSQLHEISGNKGNGRFLPHLMGHEGCGIVERVGAGVSTVKPGDKVVMHWRPGSGIESDFPKYKFEGNEFSSGKVNTLTEMAIVSENRITVIPHETNDELAALLGCSLSTAFGIIDNQSKLLLGESVAILGAGGVGLSLVLASRLKGASEITVFDRFEDKKSIAMLHGATSFKTSLFDISDKFDLVIDTTGSLDLLGKVFIHLSNSGRVVMVGQPEPSADLIVPNALNLFSGEGLQLRATQGGGGMPHIDIPRYLRLFATRNINIDSLMTHRFELSEINLAFNTLISGEAGRIMVRMQSKIN